MKFCCTSLLLFLVLIPAVAGAWMLDLADTISVNHEQITLNDLTRNELPAEVGQLVVGQLSQPGQIRAFKRRSLLRQLVSSGRASGVSFRGPEQCIVLRSGALVNPDALRKDVRRVLQPLVPTAKPGAPNTWFELDMPSSIPAVAGQDFELTLRNHQPMKAGRNQVNVLIECQGHSENFPVTVTLHQYSETATAQLKIKRGTTLTEDLFDWQWVDKAEVKGEMILTGREALWGASCSRTIQAGDALRHSDLKATPVILAGDRVELTVLRGGLMVSVPGVARQEGSLGQTIPVRNELTKRLVNARVKGPGMVEWRN